MIEILVVFAVGILLIGYGRRHRQLAPQLAGALLIVVPIAIFVVFGGLGVRGTARGYATPLYQALS